MMFQYCTYALDSIKRMKLLIWNLSLGGTTPNALRSLHCTSDNTGADPAVQKEPGTCFHLSSYKCFVRLRPNCHMLLWNLFEFKILLLWVILSVYFSITLLSTIVHMFQCIKCEKRMNILEYKQAACWIAWIVCSLHNLKFWSRTIRICSKSIFSSSEFLYVFNTWLNITHHKHSDMTTCFPSYLAEITHKGRDSFTQ